MIAALAFAAPAVLVLGLAALRFGPPAGPGPRGRGRTCPAVAASSVPEWVTDGSALLGVGVAPERAWTLLRWGGPAVLGAAFAVAGPVAALVVLTAAAAAPRALRPVLRRQRVRRLDAQLPAALEGLATALRAGRALAPAFVALAATAPEPLGRDLRTAASEVEHGAGLAAAIDRWAGRSDATAGVRLAGAALALGVEAGGDVARSIDRVAATLRERRELLAEVHALATQARASAGVLGLAPVGFTALVATIEPEAARFLVASPLGLACLAGGLALEATGGLWMARITSGAT